jgi:hypothetical protein
MRLIAVQKSKLEENAGNGHEAFQPGLKTLDASRHRRNLFEKESIKALNTLQSMENKTRQK